MWEADVYKRQANYGARMLGVVIGILPIILLFVIFSKQITEGLAAGAVKG